jgi:hypothetical protein
LERQQRNHEAEDAYRKALGLNPDFEKARKKLNIPERKQQTGKSLPEKYSSAEKELRKAGAVKGPFTEKKSKTTILATKIFAFVFMIPVFIAFSCGVASIGGEDAMVFGGIVGGILGLLAAIAWAGSITTRK